MRVSRSGIVFIAQREALVTHSYQDGDWYSVGFGHNGPEVKKDLVVSVAEAVALLVNDIRAREPIVSYALLGPPVAQHEYDAIFSGYYQSGSDLLKDVAAKIKAGDRYGAIAKLISHNTNAKGEYMPGLAKRRWREARIFHDADYGDLSKIKFYDGNPRVVPPSEIPFPMEALDAALED